MQLLYFAYSPYPILDRGNLCVSSSLVFREVRRTRIRSWAKLLLIYLWEEEFFYLLVFRSLITSLTKTKSNNFSIRWEYLGCVWLLAIVEIEKKLRSNLQDESRRKYYFLCLFANFWKKKSVLGSRTRILFNWFIKTIVTLFYIFSMYKI